MTITRMALAAAAFLCGVRALGYWAILELGGPRPADRPGMAAVLYGSAVLFLLLTALSAYLRDRRKGIRTVAARAVQLTGVYGLPPLALFAVVSRGEVFRMPMAAGLMALLVCFALAFRTPAFRNEG
jgi:hypothetical protein